MLATAMWLLPAGAATAQTETASIIGTLTDSSGAILPGVTVTASSPVLQVGQVTTVSDDRGEYRLRALPIGTYQVTYSLAGFNQTQRQGLRLTAGFTARLDEVMTLGSLNETITVSGASPVVDVTTTTSSTTLTRETLEVIPTSRNNVGAILAQVPGVRQPIDIGGNTVGAGYGFHAFGQDAEPWQTLEGVSTSTVKANASNQAGNYYDFSVIDEVTVRASGNDAEVPVPGIQLTAVLRPGGNEFHGDAWGSFIGSGMERNNVDESLTAFGIRNGQPIKSRWDVSATVGGFVIKNKMWFFAGARARYNENGILDCVRPDGTQCTYSANQEFQTGKVTVQFDQVNRVIGFYQRSHKDQQNGQSAFVPYGSRYRQNQPGVTKKAEWQGALSNAVFADLQAGYWDWDSHLSGYDNTVCTQDLFTRRFTGANCSAFATPMTTGEYKYHARGSLNWYRADGLGGPHDIKVGFDWIQGTQDYQFFDRGAAGNYKLVFNNGAPFQIVTYNSPSHSFTRAQYSGLYAKDVWRLGSRLTLNLGVRLAHDRLYVPAQGRVAGTFTPAASYSQVDFATWNTIVPRLHAAYDVTGDGKTVIKGGWGRFADMRGADQAEPANPNSRQAITYRWRDLNGNRDYDPGETNLDKNGADFVSLGVGQGGESSAIGNGTVNPDEKAPVTDELSASIERELFPGLGVRFSGIYSRKFNVERVLNTRRPYEAYNIPITRPDPGPDGVVGTADDPGGTLTYYDFPAELAGLANQVPMLVNDPRATRSWKSAEVALNKRMADRWQLMWAYSLTKINDPFVTNVGSGTSFAVNTLDPNSEINAANLATEWSMKTSGAYEFPWGLVGSMNYELRSGNPWARTVLVTGGRQIPSLTVRAEPLLARKLPNLHLVDARVMKVFRIRDHKLAVRVDMFNALNINTVTGVTAASGPSFGRPTSIILAGNVQVGLSYTF